MNKQNELAKLGGLSAFDMATGPMKHILQTLAKGGDVCEETTAGCLDNHDRDIEHGQPHISATANPFRWLGGCRR